MQRSARARFLGAHARGGYRGRWFGLEAGGGAYQGWDSNASRAPSLGVYPELELRAGPLETAYAAVGFGSAQPTGIHRPGAYLGGGIRSGRGIAVDLRAGYYRQPPALLEAAGWRLDLGGYVPAPGLGERLRLRLGGAIGHGPRGSGADAELSFGAAAGF